MYGVWDCTAGDSGNWLPKFDSTQDDTGIHSHDDGMIYIHPFFELSAGRNATFSHFINEMQLELTDSVLTLDDGRTLTEGTMCDGQESVLHLRRWQFDFIARSETELNPRIITENLNDERFYNDREVWILALAPLDADIPLPPPERFEALDRWTRPNNSNGLSTLPALGTHTMSALDADTSWLLSTAPEPVTSAPSNQTTTVFSSLTDEPRPEWTNDIIEFTFEPLASARLDPVTFVVLAAFDQRDDDGLVSRCDAAIDMNDRQPLVLHCTPVTEPRAHDLFVLEQADQLFINGVSEQTAYVVAETLSGERIAVNALHGRAYIGHDFDDDAIIEIALYNDALQPMLTCTRERPGGVLNCGKDS